MIQRALSIVVVTILAACAGSSPTAPASSAPPPSVALPPSSTVPPTPVVTIGAPSFIGGFSPTGCPSAATLNTAWPSDRLVGVSVDTKSSTTAEVVEFKFGPWSGSTAGEAPSITVKPADPPFVRAGSGAPVDVPGSQHLLLRFEHATLTDTAGTPTFQGAKTLQVAGLIIRAVVAVDESEGVMTWVVGYDAATCLQIEPDAGGGTIRFHFSTLVP